MLSQLFGAVLLFTLLVVITLFFYYESIILILFSNEYLVLGDYIIYIIAIIFLRYIGLVPGIILTSGGRQEVRAKAVFYSVIVSIVLNFILIPKLNIEGAFLSSLIAHIILNLIYVFYAFKMIDFFSKRNLKFILSSCLILYLLNRYFFTDSYKFLFVTIFINIFYLFLYYLIHLKKRVKNEF